MNYDPELKIQECPEVYPPSDDTFLLLSSLETKSGEEILEMGCGTGLISVHLAKAGASVTAVDINPKAVKCTKANAERNGLDLRSSVSDLFSNVNGKFDRIIFNPPYLSVEEVGELELAWSGGKSGVEPLRRFLDQASQFLKPDGSITILVSSEMDQKELQTLLSMFDAKFVKRRRFFFEELRVFSLKKKRKNKEFRAEASPDEHRP